MHITILTIGSRGDLQPYVALGKGLKAAGHQVCLATEADYQSFVLEHGLEFARLPGNTRERHNTEEWKHYLTKENHNIVSTIRRGMVKFVLPGLRELLDASWQVCQGTDAIISIPQVPGSSLIARKLGIPFFNVWATPNTATRAFPHPYLKLKFALGGTLNRLSYRLVDLLYLQMLASPLHEWQQQTLNLPPLSLNEYYAQRTPTLYGYSPTVLPKPADWPDHVYVPGYWFLERNTDWQPSARLMDFLADGAPPVYIGFGSMIWQDPAAITEMVLKAVKQGGQRAILDLCWGGLSNTDLPDSMLKIESKEAPHDWLLPQMAGAIHHGGAGTVGAMARAGIPSMVIPSYYDHQFWGKQIAKLGIGLPPIQQTQLSVAKLSAAIQTLTSDTELQNRAAAIGRQVQAENGVARAVEIIQYHLSVHRGNGPERCLSSVN